MKWLKRILCRHKGEREFIRNIYGDEIIHCNWKRSWWRCTECGARVLRDELHTPPNA